MPPTGMCPVHNRPPRNAPYRRLCAAGTWMRLRHICAQMRRFCAPSIPSSPGRLAGWVANIAIGPSPGLSTSVRVPPATAPTAGTTRCRTNGKPMLPGSSDPAFRGDPKRWNPEELARRRAGPVPHVVVPPPVRGERHRGHLLHPRCPGHDGRRRGRRRPIHHRDPSPPSCHHRFRPGGVPSRRSPRLPCALLVCHCSTSLCYASRVAESLSCNGGGTARSCPRALPGRCTGRPWRRIPGY
jgi:hypothetical protein